MVFYGCLACMIGGAVGGGLAKRSQWNTDMIALSVCIGAVIAMAILVALNSLVWHL